MIVVYCSTSDDLDACLCVECLTCCKMGVPIGSIALLQSLTYSMLAGWLPEVRNGRNNEFLINKSVTTTAYKTEIAGCAT